MADSTPRVAFYARVSTDDRDQNPQTQLHALRAYCERRDWDVLPHPYIDYASAKDMRGREAWRILMDDARKRELDIILVYRLDRAFRTVRDGVLALDNLKSWGVGFVSAEEPYIDTTSPMGELMFTISAAWAQLEGAIIGQRVKAGMARAAAQGTRLGRPSVPVDIDYVVAQRSAGLSWLQIQRGHKIMTLENGKRKKPSVTTIRNAYRNRPFNPDELPLISESRPEAALSSGTGQ